MNETGGIGRRHFSNAAVLAALAVLSGCQSSGTGPSVDSELRALGDAISSLISTADRFKTDDWKDVVPDVQSDASGVSTAFANLMAAMGKR